MSNLLYYEIYLSILLVGASGAEVDHGLPELPLGNAAVIVVVKYTEGRLHIIHLGTRVRILGFIFVIIYISFIYFNQ